jgi:hypothetical protein
MEAMKIPGIKHSIEGQVIAEYIADPDANFLREAYITTAKK